MVSEFLQMCSVLGISPIALVILLVWSLIWKAFALWKSARNKHLVWFIIILIVNTVGIFEILYIFLFSKIHLDAEATEKKVRIIKAKPKARAKKKKK